MCVKPHFALHGDLGSYVKQNPDNQESLLIHGVILQENWNAKASYLDLVDNLYHAVVNGSVQAVKVEEIAFVLHIIEKAFESAEKGKMVRVSLLHALSG